jgi:acetoin utilization deacetylase AcuC-like enzyme
VHRRSAPTGRPPGITRCGARDGLLPVQQHRRRARHARVERGGLERVLILDWDVHHGNGTNDIFRSSREVLFVSIHQAPLYPGTGRRADRGSGAGEGFTLNLPVPARSGDDVFCELVSSA